MTRNREEEVQRVVAHWLEMADAALASGRAERAAGRHNFAVNRAYYAAYYAASAALLKRGRHFAKHAGLRGAVHQDLVKAGELDPRWGQVFDRLFASRQRADYLALSMYDEDAASRLIAEATDFVAEMRRLIDESKANSGGRP